MTVVVIGMDPIESDRALSSTIAVVTPRWRFKTSATNIMVNCNPETVSTDYDTSDKLFEPITVETIQLFWTTKIQRRGHPVGGQTPLNCLTASLLFWERSRCD